jgi:hypothetical protein
MLEIAYFARGKCQQSLDVNEARPEAGVQRSTIAGIRGLGNTRRTSEGVWCSTRENIGVMEVIDVYFGRSSALATE